MLETFLFALNAILPIVLLIFLGYTIKRVGFLDEAWFKKGNKFIFKLALPVLLFYNVYNIKSFANIDWTVVIYAEVMILVVFALGLLVVRLTIPEEKQKGVILQGIFRSNFAIIGLPLAEALGGAEGMGIAAVLSAFSIPTFNILGVIALTMYRRDEQGKKNSIRDTLRSILTNPLIIGVVCGLVVLGIRSLIPVDPKGMPVFSLAVNMPFFFGAISRLASITSPFALIVMGGLFDFSAVRTLRRQILIGVTARVVVVPAIALGVAVVLSGYSGLVQFSPACYPALIALFGSPVAVSSAIMAQEMDNDGTLAGQLVVWTSIASIFTIFLTVMILRSMGVLAVI